MTPEPLRAKLRLERLADTDVMLVELLQEACDEGEAFHAREHAGREARAAKQAEVERECAKPGLANAMRLVGEQGRFLALEEKATSRALLARLAADALLASVQAYVEERDVGVLPARRDAVLVARDALLATTK